MIVEAGPTTGKLRDQYMLLISAITMVDNEIMEISKDSLDSGLSLLYISNDLDLFPFLLLKAGPCSYSLSHSLVDLFCSGTDNTSRRSLCSLNSLSPCF
jgi:hypothetical protein